MQFAKLFVLLLYNSGITHCVGIPGVQNSLFFSYLQECGIKIILVYNEKEAIAVALGINSIPQNKALLGLIGGPGITHSLTDLFFSKSTPLLVITSNIKSNHMLHQLHDVPNIELLKICSNNLFSIKDLCDF